MLYEHPEAEVRIMAAYMTLAIEYQSARGADLRQIHAGGL
ncbi:MAG: DUF2019 domain-containing protein [Xanthobacteraceae bacterium]